jgi:hypothetical protein
MAGTRAVPVHVSVRVRVRVLLVRVELLRERLLRVGVRVVWVLHMRHRRATVPGTRRTPVWHCVGRPLCERWRAGTANHVPRRERAPRRVAVRHWRGHTRAWVEAGGMRRATRRTDHMSPAGVLPVETSAGRVATAASSVRG